MQSSTVYRRESSLYVDVEAYQDGTLDRPHEPHPGGLWLGPTIPSAFRVSSAYSLWQEMVGARTGRSRALVFLRRSRTDELRLRRAIRRSLRRQCAPEGRCRCLARSSVRQAQAGFRYTRAFNRKPTVVSKCRSRNRGFSGQHQVNMSVFNSVDRTPLPRGPMLGGLFRKCSRFPVAASAYW
jgi:hypothetical protein